MSSSTEAILCVYQFHILLLKVSPAIWRRVLVSSDSTVADLHHIIGVCFGWQGTHQHRFVVRGQQFGRSNSCCNPPLSDATQSPLAAWRLRCNERLLYICGLLDKWQLQLRLERVLPLDTDLSYPYCFSGARQGPPQYCAGPADFMTERKQHSRERVDQQLLALIALCQRHEEEIDNCRVQVRRLNYWLNVDHFERRTINTSLQQHASVVDAAMLTTAEVQQCRSK